MIIEFDEKEWEEARICVKINNYLKSLKCNPNYPVNLENILLNKGVLTYIKAEKDKYIANFVFNHGEKYLYVDRDVYENKAKYYQIIAFFLITLEHYKKIESANLKHVSKETIENLRNEYEEKTNFYELENYNSLSIKEKREFRKKFIDDKIKGFIESKDSIDVESILNININLPFNFSKTIENGPNQIPKDMLSLANELAKRDCNYKFLKNDLLF